MKADDKFKRIIRELRAIEHLFLFNKDNRKNLDFESMQESINNIENHVQNLRLGIPTMTSQINAINKVKESIYKFFYSDSYANIFKKSPDDLVRTIERIVIENYYNDSTTYQIKELKIMGKKQNER